LLRGCWGCCAGWPGRGCGAAAGCLAPCTQAGIVASASGRAPPGRTGFQVQVRVFLWRRHCTVSPGVRLLHCCGAPGCCAAVPYCGSGPRGGGGCRAAAATGLPAARLLRRTGGWCTPKSRVSAVSLCNACAWHAAICTRASCLNLFCPIHNFKGCIREQKIIDSYM
jgi:hypothetical protein